MTSVDSFEAVFEAFGGPASFGEAIGIPSFHAQTMKQRGSIPPAYWARTVKAAQERAVDGVTLERLAQLAEAKASERASA